MAHSIIAMHKVEKVNHKSLIRRIHASYENWLTRLYVFIRFIIIRINILALMESYLPERGKILDIGCGFGLFSIFFKLKNQARQITGIDINHVRIQQARKVVRSLNLENIDFVCEDVTTFKLTNVDGIFVLDLLHHISPPEKWHLLELCYQKLNPGGVLIIKDVTTAPLWKYLFNYVMDLLVVGSEPVYYLHHQDFEIMLERIGFDVSLQLIDDLLPYPHILLICRKRTIEH